MEIKEGTLVLVVPAYCSDTASLAIVLGKNEEETRKQGKACCNIFRTGGNYITAVVFQPEEHLVPLAQTDGSIKDPVEALRKHLGEAFLSLATWLYHLTRDYPRKEFERRIPDMFAKVANLLREEPDKK